MRRNPHICHLIKGLGRGGAESLLPQAIRSTRGNATFSVGYFLPHKDALVSELRREETGVRCFDASSNGAILGSIPKVARWLAEEKADLVHAHLPVAGIVARFAGRLAGIPVVYTEHNLQQRYHPLTRLASRVTWRLQDQVIAVSHEVADSIRVSVGEQVPLEVVHNGIDLRRTATAESRTEARRRLGLDEAAPLVGAVAVFRPQKRLDLWLHAAARLLRQRPESRFLLIGDGPLRHELEELATELGIRERVRFPGMQAEIASYLRSLDVYLMTSQFEGLPLALLEAMGTGLPIVATRVGGIPEAVTHQVEGWLVPFDDLEGIVAGVATLLDEPAMAREMGVRARARVERDFSVSRMTDRIEVLYERVLDGR